MGIGFRPGKVYPRVCGGTALCVIQYTSWTGLSPRVRGNLHEIVRRIRHMGSIPACAGEPSKELVTVGCQPGLSPRVRGNHGLFLCWIGVQRSIPACAGEPHWRNRDGQYPAVYPRVCGGTVSTFTVTVLPSGLSPRVRGNLELCLVVAFVQRSIPACAGEPFCWCVLGCQVEVYPRVCGGTSTTVPTTRRCRGLSPRVRGNL